MLAIQIITTIALAFSLMALGLVFIAIAKSENEVHISTKYVLATCVVAQILAIITIWI